MSRKDSHARANATCVSPQVYNDVPVARVWRREPDWRGFRKTTHGSMTATRTKAREVTAIHHPNVRLAVERDFDDVAIGDIDFVGVEISLLFPVCDEDRFERDLAILSANAELNRRA